MSMTGEKQIELMNERQISDTANAIAVLNDRFRSGIGGPVSVRVSPLGRVVLTGGVVSLGSDVIARVLTMTATYGTFTPENDPHGEHDFGSFVVGVGKKDKVKVFWKIDYYARFQDGVADFDHGSEAPEDVEKTYRVLTVLLADEY